MAAPPDPINVVSMLDTARRTPQRAGVHAIGIKREHPAVKLLRALRTGSQPVEIENVLLCLRDRVGRIGGTRPFVSCDDSTRLSDSITSSAASHSFLRSAFDSAR